MMSQRVQDAINEQIRHELASAYIYLSMSAYFEHEGFPGFAHWMRMQASEEEVHALKLFDHMADRGARIVLQSIDQPKLEWDSPLQVFESALEHERKVTSLIHRLYKVAQEESDYPAQVMLQWFIDEQVEEEKSAGDIVDRLRMAGDHAAAILFLDSRMGERSHSDHD